MLSRFTQSAKTAFRDKLKGVFDLQCSRYVHIALRQSFDGASESALYLPSTNVFYCLCLHTHICFVCDNNSMEECEQELGLRKSDEDDDDDQEF
jgi:hypothetical protein